MQFHIIDQNYLREDDLADRIGSSGSDEYFVITDAAFIEMTKSSKWEYGSQKSLQVICKYTEKILLSESSPDLIRKELSTKRPIGLSDMFPSDLTESFCDYLKEFQSQSQSGQLHSYMTNVIKTERPILDRQQLNHASNLGNLKKGCNKLKRLLNADSLKRARCGTLTSNDLKENIATLVLKLTVWFLKDEGFSEKDVSTFLMQDSFIVRYQIAFTMLCLRWIAEGGVESLPAEKATNEIMDMDYALIASYGDSIISKEDKVHRQLNDIKTIGEILNP